MQLSDHWIEQPQIPADHPGHLLSGLPLSGLPCVIRTDAPPQLCAVWNPSNKELAPAFDDQHRAFSDVHFSLLTHSRYLANLVIFPSWFGPSSHSVMICTPANRGSVLLLMSYTRAESRKTPILFASFCVIEPYLFRNSITLSA